MLKMASFFPFLFLHQLHYESCMVLQPMRLWLMMGRVTLLLHDLYLESCARTQKMSSLSILQIVLILAVYVIYF